MAIEPGDDRRNVLAPLPARPLVSIIVPSYNQARFVRKTLDSILSQDYRPLEVLVIDGASTDGTVDILREFDGAPELRWLSEPDSGVVEAVNKGFALARGEVGAIQSSDDFYLPGAVAAGVAALQTDPAPAFAFGDVAKVDADGRELARTQFGPYSLEAVLSCESWIPQPSTFFRMDVAKSLGGWRAEVPYAADTDLWLRMALRAPAARIPRMMAERTMHDAQRDKQGARIVRDYARAIATLPGLSEASPRVRSAALAGKYLVANRYDPGLTELVRAGRLWRAAIAYPPLFSRYPLYAFFPLGPSIRAGLSRFTRTLGLR